MSISDLTEQPTNLVRSLINAAEKASNIARACRSNTQLLDLLVQEKSGDEANERFAHDFKTLADVLIQETIKHDIGSLFPAMADSIRGEESPSFTNQSNESVIIEVGEVQEDTEKCLATVLHGHPEAASVLATEVHSTAAYQSDHLGDIPELPEDLDYTDLGIWIDPIDGTAEYIAGDTTFTDFPGITSTGLDCVTVLIGVYSKSTGQPVIGVVAQPFHKKVNDNSYESLLYWGVALPGVQANNCKEATPAATNIGIFSNSERADILQRIKDLGYELAFSAGAGHKALKVITQEADFYLLSKGSTFRWDTCAPQAILRSLGGDIFDFKESIGQRSPIPLGYLEVIEKESSNWKCNCGGLIAVRDANLMTTLLDKLME